MLMEQHTVNVRTPIHRKTATHKLTQLTGIYPMDSLTILLSDVNVRNGIVFKHARIKFSYLRVFKFID
tara:strand:- start:810 stop:1013 length:204 start_codon:yes stop_codon:yes gene_type:complete